MLLLVNLFAGQPQQCHAAVAAGAGPALARCLRSNDCTTAAVALETTALLDFRGNIEAYAAGALSIEQGINRLASCNLGQEAREAA